MLAFFLAAALSAPAAPHRANCASCDCPCTLGKSCTCGEYCHCPKDHCPGKECVARCGKDGCCAGCCDCACRAEVKKLRAEVRRLRKRVRVMRAVACPAPRFFRAFGGSGGCSGGRCR